MSKDIYNPCSSRLIEGMLDPLVGHLKNFLSESFFIENERWLGKTGNIFAIIAAFAFLVIGLRFAIKEDSFNMFLMGIGVFLGVILVQYVAIKFVTPTLTGIQNAQTAISDNSVLSTIALLIFLSGLAALIGGIYMAIESDEFQLFLMGIGIFFSTLYASCLYLNPSLINIVIVESSTPAGDALGIVSSVIKVLARSIVIVYGSWVTIGTIDLVFTTVSTFKDTGDYALAKIIGTVPLITAGLTSPISTFFIFTFAMLSIEWTSEILGINRRLEAIARLFRNSSQNAVQKQ